MMEPTARNSITGAKFTHKVKDDSGDDNAADNSPNAKRQNAGVAQHAIGSLGSVHS